MSLVNSVLPITNAKDSRWLTLEVCREYQRNKCSRSENDCKFAHPPPHVEVNNGRVVCCFDSLKNRCNRTDPPCKYLHPPSHLRDQLLQNGRNNLILKNIQMGMLQHALLSQSGLLQLGPYMPLATTAAPNLAQHPYVAGGSSPFLGGASPLPLISPAPGSDPGLLTAASPSAAAAAVAGLTPVMPSNLAAAAVKTMQPNGPTTFGLVHPTSASPVAANSMFGPPPVSSAHASFVAAATAAAALQANHQVKGLSGPYTSMPTKGRASADGLAPVGGTPVPGTAENGLSSGGSGGGCPVSVAGGPPASLLAAAAVASMNSQAITGSFQQSHGATPPAAALATMQLPTGQQAYIPAHPGPGDFSPFAANAGHPSAIHRF